MIRGENIVVVLGARAAEHEQLIKHTRSVVVHHTEWARGMGSSLKAGIQYVQHCTGYDAALVLVCDQPYLTAEHLQKLIDHYATSSAKIVASRYGDVGGVPALFDKSMFNVLLNLGDEEGARKLIDEQGTSVSFVAFDKGEIDLDTPEQYQHLVQRMGTNTH